MSSGVVVLITNYKRPENVPQVIGSWREQSVQPDAVIVVDNAPYPPHKSNDPERPLCHELYPGSRWWNADDIWRFTTNLGCPCYFGPAAALFQFKYILHADDDFLPGSRAIETLLDTAEWCCNEYATIGQFGRTFRPLGYSPNRYVNGNCNRGPEPIQCDLTCRVQFFCQMYLKDVLQFQSLIAEDRFEGGTEGTRLASIHDDFLVALGIQKATGYPSYLIPISDDPERQLIKANLPEPGACWRRPEHFKERNRMIDLAESVGWKSLVGVMA